MESYKKRKKLLQEKYGKLVQVKLCNDEVLKKSNDDKYGKEIADITDKDGLYQHYNKLFIAGTKDFPADHTDGLKSPFDDTLNLTNRGRDADAADAYYRSHHEIDTVIGHSLGGAVALSLEKL